MEYLTSPERVTAKRTRAAVDKLAALQFDGRGNRIGREARALLEHEHQRLAVGQVTVPAPVNLSEAESFGNHCVVAGSSFGSLIHTAVGSAGGSGGLRAKRSGWAA